MKSAGLKDEDILDTEEAMLQTNQLSVEEVARRRGELRKMRELMFRAEVKARRIGKIKSKTYRRIKRKEKERTGEKIDEHEDEDEKLRRRVKGIDSDESEDDDDDDDGDDGLDVEGGLKKIKQRAFDELQKLNEAEEVEGTENQKGKGIFEMKFMKDAMARQMQATNKSMDDFIQEIGGNTGSGDSDGEEQENGSKVPDPSSGVLLERKGGRVTYRPSEPVGFHVTYGSNYLSLI